MHSTRDGCSTKQPIYDPPPGEDVVITGMAGQFPDSTDVYHFRDNLYNKVDLVSPDHRRWKEIHSEVPQRTGKIYDVEKFDAGFFGVPKLQSNLMDPMVRLLYERTFEAIVDAGYHPSDLAGTNTGVFVGACFSETEKVSFYTAPVKNAHALIGCTRSMLAHRMSYFFGLMGPSLVADTACSSSMVAFEHAYRAMREGLCDKAIVGGSSLCLHPIVSLQFARLGVLSLDGSCKTFDDDANGYARSEAICAILLEKSKDARRIYARVVHAKTNCDGFKEQGITYPSSNMQKELMKEIYDECGVDPTTLTFVEAHGTGTKVGDPEELNTLDEVFCTGRNRPLYVGAIKSNIGHNEPVSGLCAIIKVLIGMENGFIPPNINFKKNRAGIAALETGRIKVVSEKIPWPDENGLVGVNSFGFGGANAHALLHWNAKGKVNRGTPKDNLPRLVCVSGRTREAIEAILDDVAGRPLDAEYVKLLHVVFGKEIVDHMFYGYSIVGKNGEIDRSMGSNAMFKRKICFLFDGFDQDWSQIGYNLLSVPLFAATIQKIQTVLAKETNVNICDIITSPRQDTRLTKILKTVAIQIGLAEVLKAVGIVPDFLIGIATGDLVAAYVVGCLTLKEVVLASLCIGLAPEESGQFGKELGKNLKKIVPDRKLSFKNWLTPQRQNNANAFYCQGSVEYFRNSMESPIPYDEAIMSAPFDCVKILIGSNGDENLIQLVGSDSDATNLPLFRALGRLYLHGCNIQLDKLYPDVKWPVSRGTPMISPLIKWEHSTNHAVSLYKNVTEVKGGQRVVHVVAQMDDWNFVTGHVIDGRNLFPATGYLVMAWESLAIITGKLVSEMKICFENVKFIRACNVPTKGSLELIVTVQSGTKRFEITEGGAVVVTGSLYELDKNEVVVDLPLPASSDTIMNEKDIYKELRLRGYHYKGQFRGFKSCDAGVTKGGVLWKGNWISFMDCMLQMQILKLDTRNLYVPTSIQRVVVDAPAQIRLASLYAENNILPVYYYNDAHVIRSGGVEISGGSANSIPRRKGGEPVVESYMFVPNEGTFTLDWSARIMTQIVLENANTIKVKSVEVDRGRELLSPLILKALGDIPLIQPEIIVLSNRDFDFPGVTVENKIISTEMNSVLVIETGIFGEDKDLTQIMAAVEEKSGYIISRESANFDVSLVESDEVEILCVHRNQTETILLVQKSARKIHPTVIDVTDAENTTNWLPKLQAAIKTNHDVLVYAQGTMDNGILGLVNCLRREPNGNKVSCLFMTENVGGFDLNGEFCAKQLRKNLAFNVWKGSTWGTYRHMVIDEAKNVESEHCFVNVAVRGDLSSLRWFEGSLNRNTPITPERALVHVYCAAINFRDVMTASGRIGADIITKDRVAQECVQGFEFSGRDSTGKRVMGMVTSGALSTLIMADSHLLWPIPDQWSMEQAATIPVVYGTVIYALLMRARMERGQSILIHSGTGGVGQAAINIALHYGCTVFTTVGTREKRDFIKRHFPLIKDTHIGNSRDTSFEQMVYHQTEGRGVDIVLNSLAEEKLQASVRCLAPGGKFMEIGKFDLANDNALRVQAFSKKITFEGIMLDALFECGPDLKETVAFYLKEGIKNGSVKPLPMTVFKNDELEQAFRFMATGKHIGKVLVNIRKEEKERVCVTKREFFKGIPRFHALPDETYVILGGLGGFGLELADWLIVRGARKLVLTSRTGVKSGYQRSRLSLWKSYGVKVSIRIDDASSVEGCEMLINAANSLGPVSGIFNLAVVLKDALFENQTEEDFNTSLAPKARAARNLDAISRKLCPHLKQFVMFSSVSCGRGNAGQTNYGMANSIMERICEQRNAEGYPAMAIQWGAVGDVGLVAEMQEEHKELVIGGTVQQRISSCLQILDKFLRQKEPIVACTVVAEKRSSAAGANNIVEAVSNIIGINDIRTISLHATFPELGMDSMMAVEIKQTLEREYEVFLTPQDIRTMTVSKLQDLANRKVDSAKPLEITSVDAVPVGVKLLLRHVGNEETSNVPVLRLNPSAEQDGRRSTVYMLPGIEGIGLILKPVAEKLKGDALCLQYGSANVSDSLESLAKSLYPHMESTRGDFTLVAHSYGCLVALELVHLLEQSGRYGKVVFIDGSIDLMELLVKRHLQIESDELFQTSILCALMARYMSFEEILKHKFDILKCKSIEDRITHVLSVSPKTDLSPHYLTEMYRVAYLRMSSILKYAPQRDKLKSKVKLLKASEVTVADADHDFGVSKWFENVADVEVFHGDHLTILENPGVPDAINRFFEGGRVEEVAKAPFVPRVKNRVDQNVKQI